MKLVDISFDQKFKLYSIQKSLKEFYELGSCRGINDCSGSHLYDWLHDQKPIDLPIEQKKELWILAKKSFNEHFKHRLEDEAILHEVYKTFLVEQWLIKLQSEGITVKLELGI